MHVLRTFCTPVIGAVTTLGRCPGRQNLIHGTPRWRCRIIRNFPQAIATAPGRFHQQVVYIRQRPPRLLVSDMRIVLDDLMVDVPYPGTHDRLCDAAVRAWLMKLCRNRNVCRCPGSSSRLRTNLRCARARRAETCRPTFGNRAVGGAVKPHFDVLGSSHKAWQSSARHNPLITGLWLPVILRANMNDGLTPGRREQHPPM